MAPEIPSIIFTAIVFRNDGEEDEEEQQDYDEEQQDNGTSMVIAPLLQHYDDNDDDDEIPMGNHEKEEEDTWELKSFHKLISLGVFIGFLTQVVSLGAYHASTFVRCGDHNLADVLLVHKTEEGEDCGWWFFYSMLSILTQIDICVHIVIWIAFACIMTRVRMAMLRDQHHTPEVRRRFVVVSGVLYIFLVGFVMGAFIALSMIDAYLGFLVPFLLSVATVTLDLVFCYTILHL
jgi:hypothetical protein